MLLHERLKELLDPSVSRAWVLIDVLQSSRCILLENALELNVDVGKAKDNRFL